MLRNLINRVIHMNLYMIASLHFPEYALALSAEKKE